MKRIYFLIMSLLIINLTSAQWTQLGSDIEGETISDGSGCSVSISSSGTVIAIGAEFNDDNGISSGHVRVFEYSGGDWVQMGSDIDGESAIDFSGSSISLSSDGYIIAIGGPFNDGNGANSGHVRIFRYTGSYWIQMGSDIDGAAPYDHLGYSVSLSSDGGTVAIGVRSFDGNGTLLGQIKIFEYDGLNWIQKGNDINGEANYDWWGSSVSLSSDGNIVAGGAVGNDSNGNLSGHARVYEYTGGNWIQLGNDIDGEATGDESGICISLSADGYILSIGAWRNDGLDSTDTQRGHTRVFQYTGGIWQQMGSDIDGEDEGDGAGISVSLNDNGGIVAIGASYNDGNDTIDSNRGQVRILEYNGGFWSQLGNDIDGEAEGDYFGYSVCLNGNGNTATVGATGNDGNGYNSGHVRVYYNCDVFYDTVSLTITECDSYTSPSGNYTWTSSGLYTDTIHVATGCDIIANINLTINNNTAIPTIIDTTTCDDYVSPSGNFIWSHSGTYIDVLPNSIGCDSTLIINLTSNTISSIDTVVCDSYVSPSGNYTWSNSGVYFDTIPNSIACDSIITINLQSSDSATHIVVACDSSSYTSPSGNYIWTMPGVYQDTIQTIAGCDSVVIIDLAFEIDTSITNNYYALISNETNATYQWVDCDSLFAPILGETYQMFFPYWTGSYAVIISKGGCIDTSYCQYILAEIPEPRLTNDIKIFPNPTTGIINIVADGINHVHVMNLLGKQVYIGNENAIDLSTHPKGIYIVIVTNSKGVVAKKIIKH